jgi:hypothetical protein
LAAAEAAFEKAAAFFCLFLLFRRLKATAKLRCRNKDLEFIPHIATPKKSRYSSRARPSAWAEDNNPAVNI